MCQTEHSRMMKLFHIHHRDHPQWAVQSPQSAAIPSMWVTDGLPTWLRLKIQFSFSTFFIETRRVAKRSCRCFELRIARNISEFWSSKNYVFPLSYAVHHEHIEHILSSHQLICINFVKLCSMILIRVEFDAARKSISFSFKRVKDRNWAEKEIESFNISTAQIFTISLENYCTVAWDSLMLTRRRLFWLETALWRIIFSHKSPWRPVRRQFHAKNYLDET